MKTYEDLVGDGGSDIIGQVTELGEKLRSRLDKIKYKVALMSGKGGVGKSSITANIASCLADRGNKVGILDADLNGPSIGHLLGVGNDAKLEMKDDGLDPGIGHQGIRIMSMDMLLKTADTPVMWTDADDATASWVSVMESTAIRELLADTNWGELDYLLIDMPPGTSDIQMGLARMLPRTDVLIVTTPAKAAQQVAARAADMARKGYLRVAGVIENMGPSTNPDGTITAVFGSGGGQRLAESIGVPLIASIPLDTAVAAAGDAGTPVAIEHPDSTASMAYRDLAEVIVTDVAPPIEIAECSLRGTLIRAGADLDRARARAEARLNEPNRSGFISAADTDVEPIIESVEESTHE